MQKYKSWHGKINFLYVMPLVLGNLILPSREAPRIHCLGGSEQRVILCSFSLKMNQSGPIVVLMSLRETLVLR